MDLIFKDSFKLETHNYSIMINAQKNYEKKNYKYSKLCLKRKNNNNQLAYVDFTYYVKNIISISLVHLREIMMIMILKLMKKVALVIIKTINLCLIMLQILTNLLIK